MAQDSTNTMAIFARSDGFVRLIQEQQDILGCQIEHIRDLDTFETASQEKSFLFFLNEDETKVILSSTRPLIESCILKKPFSLATLHAFLTQKETQFRLGHCVFYPEKKRLFPLSPEAQTHYLTEKESALLECLLQQPNKTMSRRELLQKVWNYPETTETHTLETHVYFLRQKIEKNKQNPEILLNEGDGYRIKTRDDTVD